MYRIEQSRDGSHTVYSEEDGSYFHNPNGAVEESMDVYFRRSGLLDALQDQEADEPLSVMEIGFGTGLNLLLLADMAEKYEVSRPLFFTSVEAFPLCPEHVRKLNYREFLDYPRLAEAQLEIFSGLHAAQAAGDAAHPVSGTLGPVACQVFPCTFDAFTRTNAELRAPAFTHVMHDPFAPDVSPELWAPEVFSALKARSGETAVLTTYGASTAARAFMLMGGWLPARAPGALGKREMTIAALHARTPVFSGHKRLNETRLRQRYNAGDFGH